ncbi:uncharacterized protein TRIADDRAFT_55495 [Trichoplax adhaerens]|uniref:Rab-GAP TBC domain-containing protein n=1 Tax=Trichoplax adhaerens TaxID=10228 RepID=B3RV18_TRIAD|nr:hypothetical protein TRIADDRAFT_55495 [Trichoplax adhaerens]EDV25420.1 hypothetical protein TRIADDRAFT_55495 [Trichoplax adhaerens]|eukprot:XP_002111453.1 hypothetical protein TRIADDRAFT_55495 [Trichoplax adhaerens]
MSAGIMQHESEAVRIQVVYEDQQHVEIRAFAVDPSITSYNNLKFLLMGAFKLQCIFAITYLSRSATSLDSQIYLALNSDWDLDEAFQNASDPILQLRVTKIKLEDDEINLEDDIVQRGIPSVNNKIVTKTTKTKAISKHISVPFKHTIKNHISKRWSRLTSAFNDSIRHSPVTMAEWQAFLDEEGQLLRSRAEDLRMRVFNGGVEPNARQIIWPHLLSVFPAEMTEDDRSTYLVVKGREYARMKLRWQGLPPEKTADITSMIMKDVLRTDRSYPYFAVESNHPNLLKLFNILATYAFTYPEISYCQGMSDLAAPLLVTMTDEATTFWCFNALMSRMKVNFSSDGSAMMTKFEHLSQLLDRWDPEFCKYLKDCGAGDMFFCYRWILLDLKREFSFNDALRLYEIIWSTLPHNSLGGLPRPLSAPRLNRSCSNPGTLDSKSDANCNDNSEAPATYYSHYGYGSPFVLFLCLSILLQHRDHIMRNQMDHNTMAMYFDRLVRKHDLNKVVIKARLLFSDFLRTELAPESDPETATPGDYEGVDSSISC